MKKVSNSVNRRSFLGGGAALGVVGASSLPVQLAKAQTAGASKLRVSVTLNGATYVYPDGPKLPSYYVEFREDGRIVFHLGALGDLAKGVRIPPAHLGPHHVKIENGSAVLLDTDVPAHWWNAQWTYRPSPVQIKKGPADIVAAHRMFRYGDSGARVPPAPNFTFKGPMDSAGVTLYMPTTGERADIGLITDPSAYFLMGRESGPMIAWGLAAGSVPMHFRDEATGKPIDLIKYPSANAYDLPGLQGYPFLLKGLPDPRAPKYSEYGGGWTPQQAHYPELSYVAHLASGDLGFLEDLQYSANFMVLTNAYTSNQIGKAVVTGELRGVAWGLRNLFMAHVATQDQEARGPLPSWLHPSSYWKALLSNSLTYWTGQMNGAIQQAFSSVGGDTRYSPWMHDYLCLALALGVLTGHSEWANLYLFNLGNVIKRTNGTSGWPVAYCTPYRMNTTPNGAAGQPLTWKQAFDEEVTDPEVKISQTEHDALVADQHNGGRFTASQDRGYAMGTRAVLVQAKYLERIGVLNVSSKYPELDTCVANLDKMIRANGAMNARVSIIL